MQILAVRRIGDDDLRRWRRHLRVGVLLNVPAVPASSHERRRQQSFTAAALFGVAALVTGAGLVLPHSALVDTGLQELVALVSAAIAVTLLVGGARTPSRVFAVAPLLGAVLISLSLFSNGERHGAPPGGDEMYYLWVVLWAAYYLRPRILWIHVACTVAAYAVTLHEIGVAGTAVNRWISLSGLLAGTALVVSMLARRTDRLIAELRVSATTDPLTGLANRRALESAVDRETGGFRRDGRPFAILTIDVDRFKELNDRLGHAAGDRALAVIADVLRRELRVSDVGARIGGDEFAAVLRDTDGVRAASIERRLSAAAEHELALAGLTLGISVGTAVAGPDGATLDELLRTADARLYEAKRRRRASSRAA